MFGSYLYRKLASSLLNLDPSISHFLCLLQKKHDTYRRKDKLFSGQILEVFHKEPRTHLTAVLKKDESSVDSFCVDYKVQCTDGKGQLV